MVKIIKKGTRDIRECDNCGCLFSFDREDVEITEIGNKDAQLSRRVTCPQCNKHVYLDLKVQCENIPIISDPPSPCGDCKATYKQSCCGCESYFKWKEQVYKNGGVILNDQTRT